MEMNSLERFKASFGFRKTDRLPIHTFGGWIETYERWRKEGLPEDWRKTNYFGEDACCGTGVHLGTNGFSPFFPRFEERLVSKDAECSVISDEHGRLIRRRHDEVNVSIVEHLEFPLKSREDWDSLKRRLDPEEPSRYVSLAKHPEMSKRAYPVIQPISGTFRLLWHLLGDVNMAYIFYDDPELVHQIMRQWVVLNAGAIDRMMPDTGINVLTIMEDMSCNTGMMVSPAIFREFMMPYYKELISHVRRHPSLFGVWVDSDGDVSELIPLLLECGVDGLFPFEVQAGMDVVAIRRQYGERLVIRGGIDKREIAKGKEAIDRELERVLPSFVASGGYFVCLDHQAPPDISLEDYMYFLERVKLYR